MPMPPLIDYNLWATWQQLYDLDAEPDAVVYRPHVRLSYHRAVIMKLMREQANAYVSKLGWTSGQHILIAGCGFGWSAEVLVNELGFPNVVGIDTSVFVQTNKSLTEEADINTAIALVGLNPLLGDGAAVKAKLFDGGTRARVPVLDQNGQTVQSRNAIKQAFPANRVDIAFTETLLEAWSDADCLTISAVMHQLAPIVQHIVDEAAGQTFPGNWKTLAQWKALLPNDTFLATGTYQVL